ncbi:MAG: ATP-binding cassette domain-containing protein [Fusobacterium sp. JB019]|nr:ATP-binding cassette domain-containing protein [Fusobacterium sp. JB019]
MINYYGLNINNLKNIDITFPENKITVITGVSGSGKSSLVFDSIYALSRNTYLDLMFPELSSLGQKINYFNDFHCDKILPSVSMKQIKVNNNVRSTVGTLTKISEMLRQIFVIILKSKGKDVLSSQFSPNTPYGACKECNGLGIIYDIDLTKIIDFEKSIDEGAVLFWKRKKEKDLFDQTLIKICEMGYLNIGKKIKDFSEKEYNFLMKGKIKDRIELKFRSSKGKIKKRKVTFLGVLEELLKYKEKHSASQIKEGINKEYFLEKNCKECNGSGIRKENLEDRICELNYSEVENLTFKELKIWLNKVKKENILVKEIINIMLIKIKNIIKCNLEYISINRRTISLSGGEYQRIRLASAINDSVSNMLFIFDEPSSGLHPKDIDLVIKNILKIKENNNTIIIVEHNNYFINKADYIIDIGPKAGIYGGEVLYNGPLNKFKNIEKSATFNYRNGISLKIKDKTKSAYQKIIFKNLKGNNIKDMTLFLKDNQINALVGVSGSGKSTLLELLEGALKKRKYELKDKDFINYKVVKVEQTPISRNSRSIVSTYLNIYDEIRKLFSKCEDKNGKKYKNSFFSFNIEGGRCEFCKGNGVIKYSLDFMEDIYEKCEVCKGKRFNKEALSIKFKNKDIAEILDMTIKEGINFFKSNKKIYEVLKMMDDLGMGYIKLGQPSNSLSGGESQRIKLVSELGKLRKDKVIYMLDEPSSGLHLYDIEKLYKLFLKLKKTGDTIVIATHDIELIKLSDNIIELGPGSSADGGKLIANGTLEKIECCEESIIGKYLK